jgi:hypothetical protein
MSDEELEANLLAILSSIRNFDPRSRKGAGGFEWPFLTHVLLESKPCPETFKLDHDALMVKAASFSASTTAASGAAADSSSSDSESDDEEAKTGEEAERREEAKA